MRISEDDIVDQYDQLGEFLDYVTTTLTMHYFQSNIGIIGMMKTIGLIIKSKATIINSTIFKLTPQHLEIHSENKK